MKTTSHSSRLQGLCGSVALALALIAGRTQGAPLGTAFTYQGRLAEGGSPATGSYDLKFSLFDAATGGGPAGTPTVVTLAPVGVTNGLFTVTLDFGGAAFAGSARWLELAIRSNGIVTAHTVLTPRQPLTPAPYALYAPTAGTASSAATAASVPWTALTGLPAGFADGIDNDTTYGAGAGLTLSGTAFSASFGGSGAATTVARSDHNHTGTYSPLAHTHTAPEIVSGTLDDARLSLNVARLNVDETFTGHVTFNPTLSPPFAVLNPVKVANLNADLLDDKNASDFWQTGGNSGTAPGPNFLGTTDPAPLEFRVNATRALRLEPNGTSPNLIGGYQDNLVVFGVAGATISGGGQPGLAHTVIGDFGTVGGGFENVAGLLGTVSGGRMNRAAALHTSVGGGAFNTASGTGSTVAGGQFNLVSGTFGSIGGGLGNEAGAGATVAGGTNNLATGTAAVIGGGEQNQATSDYAFIGGGLLNTNSGVAAVIAGGSGNAASGTGVSVGGGVLNRAGGEYSVVGGGYGNRANGIFAVVPGGEDNVADGRFSFAAGNQAKAIHANTFVWSDDPFFAGDFSSTAPNQFLIRARGGMGIGTDSPTRTLDVVDGIGANGSIQVGKPIANGDAKLIYFGDGDYVHIGENGADDRLELKGGSVYFNAGVVGIGTTTPTHKLEVNGDVAGVGPYVNLSDARFKTNVVPVSDALEKVLRLRGVTHDWRRAEYPGKNFNGGRQLGFIAQEVKEVLPEVVSQDNAGYYSIAYSQIIPVLVEAIKEQQRTIGRLTEEKQTAMGALEKQLTRLQKQMAVQQQAVGEWEARFSTLEKACATRDSQPGTPALKINRNSTEEP